VPDILPRRRVLAASAAALPVLLATAACRSSEVFAGPDPLAGRPSPAPDVITLQSVIGAEHAMIALYQAAVDRHLRAGDPERLLEVLLAQHRQHLAQLQARLVVPPGSAASASAAASGAPPAAASGAPSVTASGAPSGSAGAGGAVSGRVTIARLRAAEQASAAGLVRQLATMPPALAQLLASIAASDATHALALGG
jgi:hypothetical protein